mmetsp:Transcript_25794/g.73353  ORF Transcript_25794/g.73353 Transcript_25794/m.73353 type:complete len:86 (-) Transcript_25794:6-263(-)
MEVVAPMAIGEAGTDLGAIIAGETGLATLATALAGSCAALLRTATEVTREGSGDAACRTGRRKLPPMHGRTGLGAGEVTMTTGAP